MYVLIGNDNRWYFEQFFGTKNKHTHVCQLLPVLHVMLKTRRLCVYIFIWLLPLLWWWVRTRTIRWWWSSCLAWHSGASWLSDVATNIQLDYQRPKGCEPPKIHACTSVLCVRKYCTSNFLRTGGHPYDGYNDRFLDHEFHVIAFLNLNTVITY